MLIIDNLCKTYANGVVALNNISLQIPNGMFGLLGPNGAGKSSLMRTLATLQEADSGSVRLGNIDVLGDKNAVKKQLGYLPQEFGLFPKETAWSLLNHFARLKGISKKSTRLARVEELLKRVNLWAVRKHKLGSYSGGMRQRFGIAQALLGNPQLLIVDEPTSGLDPQERNRFYNLLSEIGEHRIVILSTHIVEDVNDLCTNMAIVKNGTVIVAAKPQQIIAKVQGRVWQKSIDKQQLTAFEASYHVISTRLLAGQTIIRIVADTPAEDFCEVSATLEDAYFYHLNQSPKSSCVGG
jgi:ABC-type multidrug transport system ATPase subunit